MLAFSKIGQLLPNGITEPFNATDIVLPPPPPPVLDPQVDPEETSQPAQISESENSSETSSASPTQTFLASSLLMLAALTVYELYRRYLCWKSGKGSGGAVRWRLPFGWLGRGGKGGYKLVSSSSSSMSSATSSSTSSDGASWSGRSVSGESSSSSSGSSGGSWTGDV